MTIYTDKKSIIDWLNKQEIKQYSFIENSTYGFVVNVDGDVDLYNHQLTHIPVKFNIVEGTFNCSLNELTTFDWAPIYAKNFFCANNEFHQLQLSKMLVVDTFDCSSNHLINLINSPAVKGNYWCHFNKLQTLEGAPEIINGGFNCEHNPDLKTLEYGPSKGILGYCASYCGLISLKGCPEFIDGNFYIDHNQLSDLQFGPVVVQKNYIANNNKISDLTYFPQKADFIKLTNNPIKQFNHFDDYYQEHIISKRTKNMKTLMNKLDTQITKETQITQKI